MDRLRSASCLFLTLSLVCHVARAAHAPESSSSKRSPQANATPASTSDKGSAEQRALSLLGELLEQADAIVVGYERPLKLTLLRAGIADILWEHDRARAKQLFSQIFQKAEEFSPGNPIGGRFSSPGTDMRTLVRKQILDAVLTHDHEFAEEIVKSALRADASNRTASPMDQSRQEVALHTKLAAAFAASDPSRAAQLIRISLNGFWSDELVLALRALRKQSAPLADEIFLDALTLVRNKPTNITNKIGLLAPYTFPEMNNDAGLTLKEIESESGPPPGSSVIVQFLRFVFESFASQSVESQVSENNELRKASFDYFTMKELFPYFDQYLPAKAPAFRARVEAIWKAIKKAGRQDPGDSESEAWGELFRSKVEDTVARAEATKDAKARDSLYAEAASLLVMRDDNLEAALHLLERIGEEELRSRVTQDLRETAVAAAIKKGNIERAYWLIADFPVSARSARLLVEVAKSLLQASETSRARQLIASAHKSVTDWAGDNSEKDYQLFAIANIAAQIDPKMGFGFMRSAIDAINVAPDRSAGGYGVGLGGKVSVSDGYDYEDGFAALAREDFDRALSLAKTIKAKEPSLMAQIAVCRGALTPTRNR